MSQSPANDVRNAFIAVRVAMGIALGWTIWAMSPIVTGEVEPWDASSLYYSGSLFIAGMLSTLFWKDGFYWGPLGIFAGQTAFLCVQHPALSILAPLPVAIFGTLQPLAGAILAWIIGNTVHGVYVAFKNDFAAKADVTQPAPSTNA